MDRGPDASVDDLVARLESLRAELSVAKAELARFAAQPPAAPTRSRRRWAGAALVGVVAAAGAVAGELAAAGGGDGLSVRASGVSTTGPAATPTSASAPTPTSAAGAPAPAQPVEGRVPPSAAAPPATVVVGAGQSFWAIAESVLEQRFGRPPGDAELARYWARLVAANYDRLVVGGDPDLIYPGQVLVLPGG